MRRATACQQLGNHVSKQKVQFTLHQGKCDSKEKNTTSSQKAWSQPVRAYVIYLAYLRYSLTNWITLALAWCGIATKMPGRGSWKAKIRVVSPTRSLCQSVFIQLMLNMSLHCRWWEWEVLAPADWLLRCQKLTRTNTHAAMFLLMMQPLRKKNLQKLPTVKCKSYKVIVTPHIQFMHLLFYNIQKSHFTDFL